MDKKEASKLRMQRYRKRNKSVTESVTYSPNSVTINADNVTHSPDGFTSPPPESEQPDAWRKLGEFIKRGNNLEKLQRIGGSLGKYSNEVWMGGLNLLEIGSVIGTKPGLYAK